MGTDVNVLTILVCVGLVVLGGLQVRARDREAHLRKDLNALRLHMSQPARLNGTAPDLHQQLGNGSGQDGPRPLAADEALASFQLRLDMYHQQAIQQLQRVQAHLEADVDEMMLSIQAYVADAIGTSSLPPHPAAPGRVLAGTMPATAPWFWWLRKAMLDRQLVELEETKRSAQTLLGKFEATLLYIPQTHERYADVQEAISVLQHRLDQVEMHLRQQRAALGEAEDRLASFTHVLQDGAGSRQRAAFLRPLVYSGQWTTAEPPNGTSQHPRRHAIPASPAVAQPVPTHVASAEVVTLVAHQPLPLHETLLCLVGFPLSGILLTLAFYLSLR